MFRFVPFELLNPSYVTILQVLLSFLIGAYCFISVYKAKTQKTNLLFYLTLAFAAIIIFSCTAVYITTLMTKFIIYIALLTELVLFHLAIFFVILLYNENTELEYEFANKILPKRKRKTSKANLLFMFISTTLSLFFSQMGQLDLRLYLVADIPAAVQGQYSNLHGQVAMLDDHIDENSVNIEILVVSDTDKKKFYISTKNFIKPAIEKTYTVIYLPNSYYVIDIHDENGKSLLK